MSTTTPTRTASVRSAPASDPPGFVAAVRPHLGSLYSLARRLVGDPEAAEELVQRALSKAHRIYDGLEGIEPLQAWLKRILVDCGRHHWRTEDRGPDEGSQQRLEGDGWRPASRLQDPRSYPDGLHLDLLSDFEMDDLDAVLGRLETILRVPLVLLHIEGYTTAEVADLLDTSQNTVLSRLHRGRQQFERQLWDYGQERGLLVDMRANSGRGWTGPPRSRVCTRTPAT